MAEVGVRPARPMDVDAVAQVQVRAWQAGYRNVVPAAALEDMTGPRALAQWQRQWAEAVTAPPSPQHRLLVALEGGVVVGLAAHAPASDSDQDAGAAELLTVLVDPDHCRRGHGSRLLAATVDLLREDGFSTVVTWIFEADSPVREFLASTGWAMDGARRELDMGEPVPMVRLHTDIDATDPGLEPGTE